MEPFNDVRAVYGLLGVTNVELVYLPNGDTILVDGEGLLKDDPGPFFQYRDNQPLPGRGLVVHLDGERQEYPATPPPEGASAPGELPRRRACRHRKLYGHGGSVRPRPDAARRLASDLSPPLVMRYRVPMDDITIQPRVTLRDLYIAAARQVEKRREAWEKAKADLDRVKAEAAAAKSSMPHNYWHEEHRARALYGDCAAVP